MNLCSNTDFSKYKHFISLGGNCYVAEDLSRMGLRDCSYPFDWLFSDDFSGIVLAIEDRFKDLTTEHLLFQHKNNRSRYYNQKYKFSFFHDFSKYLPLSKQLAEVKTKYERRSERFLKDISEPTIFFRYVISKNDYDYIITEGNRIEQMLKSFCPENRIIYLVHHNVFDNYKFDHYIISKDTDDWITRTPLQKNKDLEKRLLDFYYENREKNLNYKKILFQPKKFSIEKSLRRIFKKEYIHSKEYDK